MKRSVHVCLLLLVLASVCLAQTAQNDARELWLARAQNITSDLLKDGADLSNNQRAVLWGILAQRWWREDPKRARIWFINAIEVVEQVPSKETPEERRQRIETAQVLLTFVTPLDQPLTKRLLIVLSPDKSAEQEPNGTAFALISAATTILDENPERAAELGALALSTGKPTNLDPLLYGLRRKNPKLADSLFVQALALAKQDQGGMFTNILTYIAFPVQRGRSADLPAPPDTLRRQLLEILMTLMNKGAADGETNCGAVAWFIPLYGEFERLLPQQWPVLRQAINTCRSTSPQVQQRMDAISDSQRLNTVDSLLNAAADAKDVEVIINHKYRAAHLAMEHKDYELALKILNDLSPDERKRMGETWDSCQWDWAADGAIEHYKHNRFREMNLLLDGVPSDLRPLAKVAFVYRLQDDTFSELAPLIQILDDAIKELRRSNIPTELKCEWYLAILRSTIKYLPAEANTVLRDGIASLNQLKEGQPLDTTEVFRALGPQLLDMDEFVVKDALASVTSLQTRTHLRLALLAATLQRVKTNPKN